MTTKSRAALAAEKAARMNAAPAAPPVETASAPAEVKAKPAASKPPTVRVSLDLTKPLYEDLTAWNREAARRMGRTKVTNADTLRSLVRVLLDRPEVTDEVIRRLDVE